MDDFVLIQYTSTRSAELCDENNKTKTPACIRRNRYSKRKLDPEVALNKVLITILHKRPARLTNSDGKNASGSGIRIRKCYDVRLRTIVFHSSDHPLVGLLFHFYCGNNFVNVGYQRIVINYNSITLFYMRVCILCMYACIYACAYIGKSVSICMYADWCIYTVIKHAYKHTLYTRLRIHKYVIHMYVCHRLTCIHTRLRIMYA